MMETDEKVVTKRECEATEIPIGTKIKLPAGTPVRIKQSLGGAFTVVTDEGTWLRIDGRDIDVLGKEAQAIQPTAFSGTSLEQQVWDQLRTCYDPEIPVNIVELGLIYGCEVVSLQEGGHKVDVKMTLTAPGCGMGQSIAMDAKQKIQNLAGVKESNVEVVWNPPWNPTMMSETAKKRLGLVDE